MLDVALLAFWLGIVFNAAPGAVFTESLRRGMREGFRGAFAVQVGSLVGDATWAALGLAGVGALFLIDGVRVPLTLVGAALTGGLGVVSLRTALRPSLAASQEETHNDETRNATVRGGFSVGAVMSLANPLNVVYWSGAAAAVGGALGEQATWQSMAVFFAGFFAASLLWCWICAAAIALLRRALSTRVVRVIEAACGVSLVGLGSWMIISL